MVLGYTTLEQSQKLAEILPIKSADLIYIMYRNGEKPQNGDANLSTVYESNEHKWYWIDIRDESWDMRIGEDIPCWSLVSLFSILPKGTNIVKEEADTENEKYMCTVGIKDDIISTFANNPVDACYEMILKLNESKLL